MKDFEDLWTYIVKRSEKACIPVVQDKEELKYAYNIMQACSSYLEVGAAEGNSLFVLANAMQPGSSITYIDYGEKHTTPHRDAILEQLTDYNITAIHGDSNDFSTVNQVKGQEFDAVLIDAGHDAFNVAIDCLFYGHLAKKYIIFHDIQLPEVARAVNWYVKQRPDCKYTRVVNSKTFGFGILECTQ